MDTNLINKELKRKYLNYSNHIRMEGKTMPSLLFCPSNYGKDNNIPIMFIYFSDKYWKLDVECPNKVDALIKYYQHYNLTDNSKENPFIDLFNQISTSVNSGKKDTYIWTTLFPLGSINGTKMNFEERQKWWKTNFDLLIEEISICKPKFVFFVTESEKYDDTYLIKMMFGDNLYFIPSKEGKDISYLNVKTSFNETLMYRMPEPPQKKTKKYEKIVNLSVSIITNNSRIKTNNNVKTK